MVGQQFEYGEVQYWFKDHPVENKFVTVLDEFRHHYTGETIRHIRIESMTGVNGRAYTEYKTVDEEQFNRMLEAEIKPEETPAQPDYTLYYDFHGEKDTTYFNGSAKELDEYIKGLEENGFFVYHIVSKDGREFHKVLLGNEVAGC